MAVVVFRVGARRCGIELSAVERVISAVECGRLPGTPPAIIGIINFHGTAIPVLDVARRFGEPGEEVRLDSKFVVVQTPVRLIATPTAWLTGAPRVSPGNSRYVFPK